MQLKLSQLGAKSFGCPYIKLFRVLGEKELLGSVRAKSHLVLCIPAQQQLYYL